MRLGIWPDAAAHLTESLDLASELGVPTWIGDAANNLAVLCLETGDLQHAQEANAQAIAAYRPLQDHLKFAGCLETSARIAAKGEANEAALRFATAAESLWELEGTPPFPWLMSQLDRDLAGARDSLTHEQAERAIASARTMTLDEILLEATRPLPALGGEVDLPQTIVRSKVHDLDPPGISAKPFQAS